MPPHSSTLKPGIDTTRTRSPYFSPKSAIAPRGDGVLDALHFGRAPRSLRSTCSLTIVLDLGELGRRDRREVREVETQAVGRDERARLLHVRAEHLAQRRVQQVRGRVVAPRRVAARVVDDCGDGLFVASSGAPADCDPMSARQPRAEAADASTRASTVPASFRSVPMSETWPPDSR